LAAPVTAMACRTRMSQPQRAVVADLRSVGVTDPESGDPVASGTRWQPAVAVDATSGRVYVA
jgi:hypothetical protein